MRVGGRRREWGGEVPLAPGVPGRRGAVDVAVFSRCNCAAVSLFFLLSREREREREEREREREREREKERERESRRYK